MPKPLRVVLADDERPARRFLANLLKTFPDVEVVGEASNGREALDLPLQEKRQIVTSLDVIGLALDGPAIERCRPIRVSKRLGGERGEIGRAHV